MKRLVAYLIACLVMLVTASGSFAQQYVNPCEGDIARFCSNLRPGGGNIADCLSQNEAQLSPECKDMHLEKLAEVIRQTQQVCESDVSQFCGAERQQPSIRLLGCLRMQVSLSPECKTKLLEALQLLHY